MRCRRCRKSWSLEFLYAEVKRRNPDAHHPTQLGPLLAKVRRDFYRKGCAALQAPCHQADAKKVA